MYRTTSLAIVFGLFLCVGALSQALPPVDVEYIEKHRSNFGAGREYDPSGKVWHCGDDIRCPYMTTVCVPVNGRIVGGSPSGWDSPPSDSSGKRQNFALLVEATVRGKPTLIILGHLLRPMKNGLPISDQQVLTYRAGEDVRAGEVAGFIGKWSAGTHLHLAVCTGRPFPAGGFGRQPMPRPNEITDDGIPGIGLWREPLTWLGASTPTDSGQSNTLPTAALDDDSFYFVRDDTGDSQSLMMSNITGSVVIEFGRLPCGEKAIEIFPGPSCMFARTQGPDGFSLWRICTGKVAKRLALSSNTFECGFWFSEADYLPLRLQDGWHAVDYQSGRINKPSDVLPPQGKLWCLIGSTTNCGENKPYLARYIVGPDGRARETVIVRDGSATLINLCMLKLQPDHLEWDPKTTKDVIWLRKDMSGCTILRSVLIAGGALSSLTGIPGAEIPWFDKYWTKVVYKSTREIGSLTVVGAQSATPLVVFSEEIGGRFVIRSISTVGTSLRDVVR